MLDFYKARIIANFGSISMAFRGKHDLVKLASHEDQLSDMLIGEKANCGWRWVRFQKSGLTCSGDFLHKGRDGYAGTELEFLCPYM